MDPSHVRTPHVEAPLAMKVHYITMGFPLPSETFATNDVRGLSEREGVDICVHSLRPRHSNAHRLAHERGVSTVEATYGGLGSILSGLATGFARPRLARDLMSTLVRTCRRQPLHLLKSLALVPRVLDIFKTVEAEQPDVVHIYWGHYPAMVGRLVQLRLPDVVCTMSLAAYDLELGYGVARAIAPKADQVRTLGSVNVPDIRETYNVPRDRIRVIHDGVDLDRFRDVNSKSKTLNRIATAGRLIESKGMDDVLRSFRRVADGLPGLTLTVMGDGPERQNLEELARRLDIAHAVTFLGHVSHDRVFDELSEAEVFLFMSTKSSERLPNVVKEAIGCRCLCVASATPGIDELIKHGRSGWIVPQNDVVAAARHVQDALADPSRHIWSTMTRSAYENLQDNFSLAKSVDAYVEMWKSLKAQKQR